MDRTILRRHLVASRLAGAVATSRRSTLSNSRLLSEGHEMYTFGLEDVQAPTLVEAVDAVRRLCGDPGDVLRQAAGRGHWPDDPADGGEEYFGDGYIDPDQTVVAIERHARALADTASVRGRVLLATGHPTGLLAHYATLGRALASAGCELVVLDSDLRLPDDLAPDISPGKAQVRFVDGVACLMNGADLLHTHRPGAMRTLLAEIRRRGEDPPALVIADHGMAGAALAAGLLTMSIADVNDPALPVAQARGLTDGVLTIDDNLAPRLFEPVTAAVLELAGLGSGGQGRVGDQSRGHAVLR